MNEVIFLHLPKSVCFYPVRLQFGCSPTGCLISDILNRSIVRHVVTEAVAVVVPALPLPHVQAVAVDAPVPVPSWVRGAAAWDRGDVDSQAGLPADLPAGALILAPAGPYRHFSNRESG